MLPKSFHDSAPSSSRGSPLLFTDQLLGRAFVPAVMRFFSLLLSSMGRSSRGRTSTSPVFHIRLLLLSHSGVTGLHKSTFHPDHSATTTAAQRLTLASQCMGRKWSCLTFNRRQNTPSSLIRICFAGLIPASSGKYCFSAFSLRQ